MSYKQGLAAMGVREPSTARMSGELTPEDRKAITGAGKDFKTAGYCILGGLVLVAIAEIVGHRNMSFKGDSFFNHYKSGRGVL